MKHHLILLGIILIIAGLSGCIQSSFGHPIVGTWETKVIGFTQTLQFESNNTGVLVTTLGQQAFDYKLIDDHTLQTKAIDSSDWEERTYTIVNNNTLILDGMTWVRKGST